MSEPEGLTAELKRLGDEYDATFAEFKAANDAQAEEIKKLGAADVVTTEKVDRANEALTEIRGLIDEAILTAKTEAEAREEAERMATERIDKLEVESKRKPKFSEDPEQDSKRQKAVEAFWLEHKAALVSNGFDVEKAPDVLEAYEKAFDHYIRRSNDKYGQDLEPDMRKALSVGIEADGGYWVKPVMSDRILTRVFETSPIRQIANVVTISTDAIEFPTDTNDATVGGWVGETASRDETATPQTGMARISVHEQYANPRATQKLLDDAAFPVEQWLGDKIASKLARDENTAFVSGNGEAKPRGFTDYSGTASTTADSSRAWGTLQYTFTGANGGFDTATSDATASSADELIDIIATLNPVYRQGAVWTMSRATEAECRKLRDANGNYVVDRNFSDITRAPFGFNLFGFPIVTAEDMPALATDSFSIAFGNFNVGYQIVDRQGIRTLRDPFSAKPYVQFYTTKRVGGDVVNFDAIKLLKFGTS